MADINKEASWVTARLMEVSNATQDGTNILITNANIQNFTPSDVVRTSAQELTDAQKAQVRTNIGAASQADIAGVQSDIADLSDEKMDKLPEGSVAGNIPLIDNNLNIADSGKSLSDIYNSAMIHKTASGSIVTIEDGADNVPIKEMTVQIEPVQEWKISAPTPSPASPLLIYGWDTLLTHTAGANLWGGEHIVDEMLSYIPSGSYDAVNRTFDFSASASVQYLYGLGRLGFVWLPWKENTQYTFILTIDKSAGTGLNLNCVYTDGTSVVVPGTATPGTKKTFVFTSAAGKTVAYIGKRNSGGNTILYLDECGVFEGVLTADEFVPYDGETHEITFPSSAGIVYGGELTVNEDGTGTLTASHIDALLSSFNWTYVPSRSQFVGMNGVLNDTPSPLSTGIPDVYAEAFTPYFTGGNINIDSVPDNSVILSPTSLSSGKRLLVKATAYASNDAFLAAVGNTKMVLPLAEPVTYQLTASQVSTLLGLNNIWADTGDISITYRADPALATAEQAQAIKKSIAPVEDGYTASQAYAVGDYLYVGDTLYVVTSAIASGATITPGTNVSEEPLADGVTGLSEWESAAITINSTYLTSANALYCRVNRKLKIAVLFGWYTIGTIPSTGGTLFTIAGIKPFNSYCYTYAHRGASIISMRPAANGANTNINVDTGTSGNMTTGAHALQTAVIPIQ